MSRATRYSELLKDGRWIVRRLQILERMEYTCEECGAQPGDPAELNVHHRSYRAGALPWEYEDTELMCLCRDCHAELTDWIERAHRLIGRLPIAAFPTLVREIERLATAKYPRRLGLVESWSE